MLPLNPHNEERPASVPPLLHNKRSQAGALRQIDRPKLLRGFFLWGSERQEIRLKRRVNQGDGSSLQLVNPRFLLPRMETR